MKVRKDLKQFLKTLPKEVTLVAATKYVDSNEMLLLFSNGVNNFGENRADSFLEKYNAINRPGMIWHFIGHLQRNKAKEIINKIDCLHSLDSLDLVEIIEKERIGKPLECFVEVSINHEANKNGVEPNEVKSFISKTQRYHNIKIVGLMMMSVAHSNEESLNKQFNELVLLKNQIEKELHISLPYLSMGMSDDYLVALKNEATHIRLGRILFDK